MYTDNYELPLARLHANKISYQEFLKEAGCHDEYQKWCERHHLKPDEGSAQCYFDNFGFEESTIVKEYIQPVE